MMEDQEIHRNPKGRERSLQTVSDFCQELIACLHMDLVLDESREEDGIIHINFTGPDRPFLLSNSASLLNSMEFLLNKVFRTGKDETPGIMLDSDKYRQHREAELVLLAQMASKKVISFRKPLSLQPMIPRERRIVHLALAGIEGVRTQSDGVGDNRSITIYPA
jgi:spoIIIJ-associated protein